LPVEWLDSKRVSCRFDRYPLIGMIVLPGGGHAYVGVAGRRRGQGSLADGSWSFGSARAANVSRADSWPRLASSAPPPPGHWQCRRWLAGVMIAIRC
jgi:hypothetical protein